MDQLQRARDPQLHAVLSPISASSRSEWMTWRRQGIGGSDIAVILGLSPWRTPMDLWAEKTGRKPPSIETRAMRVGKALEPVVIDIWSEQTGGAVIERDVAIEHSEHPIARGTLDAIGMIDGHRVVVEAKTGRSDAWRDGVPAYYAAQVHWYLMLARLDRAEIAALTDGADFATYSIAADRDLESSMLETAIEWWQRHVVRDVPPEPVTIEDARLVRGLRDTTEETALLDGDLAEALARLAEIKRAVRDLEQQAREIERTILSSAPPARRLIARAGDAEIRAVWCPPTTRAQVDIHALRASHPDLAREFERVVTVPGYLRVLS